MGISFSTPMARTMRRENYFGSRFWSAAKRLALFVFALAAGGSFCLAVDGGQKQIENYLAAQITKPINEMVFAAAPKILKSDFDVDAKAAICEKISADNRRQAIFKKNSDETLPIASLTKLMTAVVILENGDIYPLEKRIVVSQAAAAQPDVPVFGNLLFGESYSARQLLELMLFYSSNDAAFALADIAGHDRFVQMMNSRAKDLGLEKTKFQNSSGLDIGKEPANVSSADDLLALIGYILDNRPEIFSMTITPGPYLTENGLFGFNLWDGQALIGGKTGFTASAGGCLVAIFENGNEARYVNIILGTTSPEARVAQMQKLVNYANNKSR